jgi:hypothetical protein
MIKLYLDIDGVLLTKRNAKAAYGPEFISFVTERFDCYWLTTHCKGHAETAIRYLSRYYDPESIAKLRRVQATDWQTLKTEGIDFSSPFYWLDDAPFESEKAHLARNGGLDRLLVVDLSQEGELRRLNEQLRSLEAVEALIARIWDKERELGIIFHPGANHKVFRHFEQKLGCKVPDAVKAFYRCSNGFESVDEDFRLIPLEEILESSNRFGPNYFYFAEWLFYCDVWEMHLDPEDSTQYRIKNWDENHELTTLTNSFVEFLDRFLEGRVYEKGGLYEWKEEMKHKPWGAD